MNGPQWETFTDKEGRRHARPKPAPAFYEPTLDCTRIPNDLAPALADKPLPWVGGLLSGPTGIGKSYQALRELHIEIDRFAQTPIADRAVGCSPKFLRVPQWIELLRDLQAEQRDLRWEQSRRLRSVSALVLDDLGAERLTEFAASEIFLLIDARASDGLPTLVTSNWSLRELAAAHGDRVASRLLRFGNERALDGEDLRRHRP